MIASFDLFEDEWVPSEFDFRLHLRSNRRRRRTNIRLKKEPAVRISAVCFLVLTGRLFLQRATDIRLSSLADADVIDVTRRRTACFSLPTSA